MEIFENTLPNILAAIIIAIITGVYSWLRDNKIEKRLKKEIMPNGVGVGYDNIKKIGTFNIQLNNLTHVSVRIRQVILLAAEGQAYIPMKFDANFGISQTPLMNEIFAPEFKKTYLAKGFSDDEATFEYIKLPPKTMGVWYIDSETIGKKNWYLRDIIIILEYPTIFGNSALIKINANSKILEIARGSLSKVSKCVREDIPFPHIH